MDYRDFHRDTRNNSSTNARSGTHSGRFSRGYSPYQGRSERGNYNEVKYQYNEEEDVVRRQQRGSFRGRWKGPRNDNEQSERYPQLNEKYERYEDEYDHEDVVQQRRRFRSKWKSPRNDNEQSERYYQPNEEYEYQYDYEYDYESRPMYREKRHDVAPNFQPKSPKASPHEPKERKKGNEKMYVPKSEVQSYEGRLKCHIKDGVKRYVVYDSKNEETEVDSQTFRVQKFERCGC